MAEKLTKKSATIDFMTYFVSLAYLLNYDRWKLTNNTYLHKNPSGLVPGYYAEKGNGKEYRINEDSTTTGMGE